MRPVVAVGLIAASTLLSMSAWFSATFVVPQLRVEWGLGAAETSALTIAVQLGFVVGALLSAATGLVDAVPGRMLMCIGGLGAAACNAGLLLCDGVGGALPLRILTGIFLAGVYPPALKEVSTWYLRSRGKALGVMIGALTIGSALPHLVGAVGGVDWRVVIATTSVLSAAGGLVVCVVRGEGAHPFPRRPVSLAAGFRSMRNRDVVLANLGYVGHMWELYAMWAGVGVFIAALPSVAQRPNGDNLAALLAFVCIGTGAAGCLVGGVLGDRWGRPRAALTALICSGGTALVLAATYDAFPLTVTVLLCAFWGFWVIADSAQFSALVTETADPDYVGGALSLQLAFGYVTTMVSLWLVPQLVEHVSWRAALVALALGPAVGILAMIAADRRRAGSRALAA
ncbi:MFS transporter [Nocardioides kongjuensis]|uniref:MFS family permease n=1 Tax=Nocardioides kongjuensis TaxID=349522 RepID=A0A852RFD3_9ACTN|nr:MFS transporter [Nocardioides kongjuensis]NYD32007.1 MFS family permease [Nocardioides kongjuensis]